MITHLTFLDVETTAKTGPSLRIDQVIEVAAARVCLTDRAITHSCEMLVRPWGPQAIETPDGIVWDLGKFHLESRRFDGVDFRKDGLDYDVVLDILRDTFLVDGTTLAGQNPAFDKDHIFRDMAHKGMSLPKLDYHIFDLASPALFLAMAGEVPGCSLRHTGQWAGCPSHRHRAMADVLCTIQVFWTMFDRFIGKVDNNGRV